MVRGIEGRVIFDDDDDRKDFINRLNAILPESHTPFDLEVGKARKFYAHYVSKGVSAGRRPEFTGSGLIRSVGGWAALKQIRRSGLRIKGDERILGSSQFVSQVLARGKEEFDFKYKIKIERPDLNTVIGRVAEYFGIDAEDLKSTGKQRTITQARTSVCYLAARRLRYTCADVARSLMISAPAVSRAVNRWQSVPMREDIENRVIGKVK